MAEHMITHLAKNWRARHGVAMVAKVLAVLAAMFAFPTLAMACPDFGLSAPQKETFAADELLAEAGFNVNAGGTTSISGCPGMPSNAYGNVADAPDFEIEITDTQGHGLTFVANGVARNCDPILLINDTRGDWHFNDDGDGLNSVIAFDEALDGWYDVWVGTVGPDTCDANLRLVALAPPATCPNVGLDAPILLNYSGDALYSRKSFPVTAGGPQDLSECSGYADAFGYAGEAPNYELNFTGAGNYRLEIHAVGQSSDCDTVLLVNTASGVWLFNDDFNDLNAGLDIPSPPEGRYDIWVGSLSGDDCDANLTFETF